MYKFKGVECPKCNHRFAWLEEPNGNSYCLYRRKGVNEELFSTVCPRCGLEMVVPSDEHTGISITDESIELFSTVRGI